MSANVDFYKPRLVHQDPKTTVDWSWKRGDDYSYWGFAIRPYMANMQVEVTRHITNSDNDQNHTDIFTVQTTEPKGPNFRGFDGGGGLLQFTAIASS